MKKKYWFFISCTIVIVFVVVFFSKNVNSIKEYNILKKKQQIIERNTYLIYQTINQYYLLFGIIPDTFNDEKLMILLMENEVDSLFLELKPKILCPKGNDMYYVYLDGPDGKNDSLKTIINKSYIPEETKLLANSFMSYFFSEGDILLFKSSFDTEYKPRATRFTYLNNGGELIIEDKGFRDFFYKEINRYLVDFCKEKHIIPSNNKLHAFCCLKFEHCKVDYKVLFIEGNRNNELNLFMEGFVRRLKEKNLDLKELYFPLYISESLLNSSVASL